MAKFAKLFDMDSSQVLFMVTEDDDAPVLKMITEVDGVEVLANLRFTHEDLDIAWEKALATLQAMNEKTASDFRQGALKNVFGMMAADPDRNVE